jgi:hypothetical protein
MLYLVLLRKKTEPTREQKDRILDAYLNAGRRAEILGALKVDGALPRDPDTYVISISLMACKKNNLSFDSKRDQIVYSVGYDPVTHEEIGICEINIAKSSETAEAQEITGKNTVEVYDPEIIPTGGRGVEMKCEFSYALPKERVFNTVLQTLENLKNFKVKKATIADGRIEASGKVTIRSWGEKIQIWILEVSHEVTNVVVTSACKVPTTVADYGKNAQNIGIIVTESSKNMGVQPQVKAQN